MTALREADIRPADLLAEYLRLSAADVAHFFPDPAGLPGRACPGCGDQACDPAFAKHGFTLVRCRQCGSLYANPCPTSRQLAAFYRDSESTRYWSQVFFPAVAEARRQHIFRPRVARIATLAGASVERLIDVGAGSGLFLDEWRAVHPATRVAAVEPGKDLAAACRAKGLETFEGFADEAAADPAWAGSADVVTSFEVIEHVPDALDYVRALAALVKPGGLVLVSGLCADGFDIRVLGPRSNAVSPPHHLTFLSRRGVAALLARAGLDLVEFLTPGKLDVDIVRNALAADDGAVTEPFLRHLLIEAPDQARAGMQDFLERAGLSSHMWFLARRS